MLGVGPETLRYYERRGLIHPPERSINGYRLYSDTDTAKIDHVLRMKEYGLSLKEIKKVLESPKLSSKQLRDEVKKKIDSIDSKLAELTQQRQRLLQYLDTLSPK